MPDPSEIERGFQGSAQDIWKVIGEMAQNVYSPPWEVHGFVIFHGDDFPLVQAVEHGQADMGWSLRTLRFIAALANNWKQLASADEHSQRAIDRLEDEARRLHRECKQLRAALDLAHAENARLQRLNEGLCERIAVQSEILTKRA